MPRGCKSDKNPCKGVDKLCAVVPYVTFPGYGHKPSSYRNCDLGDGDGSCIPRCGQLPEPKVVNLSFLNKYQYGTSTSCDMECENNCAEEPVNPCSADCECHKCREECDNSWSNLYDESSYVSDNVKIYSRGCGCGNKKM